MKKIKNVLALLIIKSLDVLGVFQGFRYTVLNLNRILEKNYPIKSVFNFIQVDFWSVNNQYGYVNAFAICARFFDWGWYSSIQCNI